MYTIKHYCLDSGQVQTIEELSDAVVAQAHCNNFNHADHGTDSVWYIDSTDDLPILSESDI